MITDIAMRQLTRRLQFAQRQVNLATTPQQQVMRATEMNARLAPWAAAAMRCGADLSHLLPDHWDDLQSALARGQSEGLARAVVADRICDTEEMRTEIARARDVALEKQTEIRADLAMLAIHLGCPPHLPADMKQQLEHAA